MLTVPDILVKALALPPLARGPFGVPAGTRCAVTGAAIESGYAVRDVTGASTAVFADVFRGGMDGYVSDAAARCFAAASGAVRAGGALWAWEDGTLWRPMISAESAAKEGRPAWRDLFRAVPDDPARVGQRCVIILATNFKKRFWHLARVTTLGAAVTLFVQDDDLAVAGNVTVNVDTLTRVLGVIEAVYAAGFSKDAIRAGLFSHGRGFKTVQAIGPRVARSLEADLAPLRPLAEFLPALLVAQKESVNL